MSNVFIKERKPGTWDIYREGSVGPKYPFRYTQKDDISDEEFGLYLASIRYLAKLGYIR